ncbi:MAG TPA: hypoxanthine-guanine phosphoribosyltransferase [Chitinolyticbacter sp.]|nr:hypoxanthine-guanine phosphoribosyltransferase [Chitinolyticbacter sp.]
MTLELPAALTIIDNADCLHSEAEVHAALDRMAAAITARVANSNPIVYTIMNGGLIVAGQLLPKLNFPLECSYLHATRYRHETSGGALNWKVAPTEELKGRSIVIIDDILDEGHTLAAVVDFCKRQGAKEVLVAVLVDKQHDRKAPGIAADFVGLKVEDRFLFGCGMDYQGYWRNTLAIYAVKGL